MSRQLLPEVDWDKVQEAFHRTTRSSGDSSEDTPSDNEERQHQQQSTSTSSTPIPSPNSDTDVEMAQEDDDSLQRAPGMFMNRASDILADSVIGLDGFHPSVAQQIRQDPDIPAELSLSLASPGLHNPPDPSTGEGGIVIDTVADPRQRGPDNRLRPPQKCLSCQTTQTPEWRRGPYGPRTLCNACGLTYAKMVRDSNNRNKKIAGTKELDSTGAATLSLSAPHQTSNAEAGPSYSNHYQEIQPSGSGMPHAGTSTRESPIDVDLHADSDSSDEELELDADLERGGDPDLAGDEMDEDGGNESRTRPPADRSDFTTAMTRPGNGHGGPHSQRIHHPHPHCHG